MTKLNPYISLPGTAAKAIELYKKVFKVEPLSVQKFKDMPVPVRASEQGGMTKPSDAGDERILHAAFQIGSDMLMISDAPEGQDNMVVMGTQAHISLHPDSRKEADRIFGLLSEGGEVVMPMNDAFWGDYFGMCGDKFGVRWMINYHKEIGGSVNNAPIAKYIDAFVLVVPKKKVAEYRKMARDGSKIWMKCGALAYKECIGEDLKPDMQGHPFLPFPTMTKMKPSETVWFSYIEYASKAQRNAVNKRVMKEMEKQYKDPDQMKKMPFDMKRFSYGGFKIEVGV